MLEAALLKTATRRLLPARHARTSAGATAGAVSSGVTHGNGPPHGPAEVKGPQSTTPFASSPSASRKPRERDGVLTLARAYTLSHGRPYSL